MVRKAAQTQTLETVKDTVRAERPTTGGLGANAAFLKLGATKSSDGEIARLLNDLEELDCEINAELDLDMLDMLYAQRANKVKQIDFARGGSWS